MNETFDSLTATADATPDVESRILSLLREGDRLRALGRPDQSVPCYTVAERLSRHAGDHERCMATLGRLADLHLVAGRFEPARRAAIEGLVYARSVEHERDEVVFLGLLGGVERRDGDPQRARELAFEAIETARRNGWLGEEVNLLADFVALDLDEGAWAQAARNAAAGLRRARLLGLHDATVVFVGQLAQACRGQGRLDRARTWADRGRVLARRWGLVEEEAAFTADLGLIALDQGDRRASRLLCREAADRLMGLGHRAGALAALRGVALAAAEEHAWGEALDALLQAAWAVIFGDEDPPATSLRPLPALLRAPTAESCFAVRDAVAGIERVLTAPAGEGGTAPSSPGLVGSVRAMLDDLRTVLDRIHCGPAACATCR